MPSLPQPVHLAALAQLLPEFLTGKALQRFRQKNAKVQTWAGCNGVALASSRLPERTLSGSPVLRLVHIGIAATVCCYIYTTLCIMRANQGNVQCDTL